jgi:hypothetical protein
VEPVCFISLMELARVADRQTPVKSGRAFCPTEESMNVSRHSAALTIRRAAFALISFSSYRRPLQAGKKDLFQKSLENF